MTRWGWGLNRGRRVPRAILVFAILVAALMVLFVPFPSSHGPGPASAHPPATIVHPPEAVDPQFAPIELSSPNPASFGQYGYAVALTPSYVVVGAPYESVAGLSEAGDVHIYYLGTDLVTTLTSPAVQAGGLFGFSVATSGNYVVVGAIEQADPGGVDGGAVYLFNSTGTLLASFFTPNAVPGGYFGWSVAMSGGTILVGAVNEGPLGLSGSGDAYFIDIHTQKIRPIFSPTPQTSGAFGAAVALSGTLAIVGAYAETSGGQIGAGNAYLFSPTTGNEIEAFSSPSPGLLAGFGYAVAIDGTVVVIGAPGAPSVPPAQGAAYEINLVNNATTTFVSPTPMSDGEFGYSVAIDGVAILVGAPDETSGGQYLAGNAYLYSEASGKLITSYFNAPEWPYDGQFGFSVAESGNEVVVGGPTANASGIHEAGQAYLFSQIPLTLSSPNTVSSGHLGESVAVGGGVMLAGAPGETANGWTTAGHVYVAPIDPSPQLSVLTLTSPSPGLGGNFGNSVAISGGIAIVGAPGETSGVSSGAGNVYLINPSSGALLRTLTSPNAQTGGEFGFSVSISGSLVVVGAPEETAPYPGAGHAYVFNATTGALVDTLTSANPILNGQFGFSVSISGNTVLVGAPYESVGAVPSAGNAYLFVASTGAPIATLTSPNVGAVGAGVFGYSVSANGGTAVVGAPGEAALGEADSGRGYIFSATSGALEATLESQNVQIGGQFGTAVFDSGSVALVGAPYETAVSFLSAGNIYVFNLASGTILDRFYSPAAQTSGQFGIALGDGGVRIVVGAPGNSGSHETAFGAAYLFGWETSPIEP